MKKFLALLLASVMTLALLAGCGGSGDTPANTDTPTNTDTDTPTNTDTDTPTNTDNGEYPTIT